MPNGSWARTLGSILGAQRGSKEIQEKNPRAPKNGAQRGSKEIAPARMSEKRNDILAFPGIPWIPGFLQKSIWLYVFPGQMQGAIPLEPRWRAGPPKEIAPARMSGKRNDDLAFPGIP